jgi:transcriptional regulator with XRE-family HTH domain
MKRTELIAARKKIGMTQAQLSEIIRISPVTISRFETGETALSSDSYIDYMRAVGMDYEQRIDSLEREIERIDMRVAEYDRNIASIDARIDELINKIVTSRL